jgi:hypothetical protein
MKQWFENVVEAVDVDAYYKCFGATTPTDKDPDTSYEKWYGPLEAKIARVLDDAGVPKSAIEFFDDWCANNTRHVTIERQYIDHELILAIHDLIGDDYKRFRWRIEVTIVGTIKGDDWLGKLGIWEDWVLCWGIGRSLLPTQA